MKAFNAAFPRVKVNLVSSSTMNLLDLLSRGGVDLILTTQETAGPGGETLTEMPLRWVGAHDGQEWRKRPLRLAFCKFCIFRPFVTRKLDEMGIAWEMAVESDEDRAVEALISADLAVGALLEDSIPPHLEAITPGTALPDLGVQQINMYGQSDRDEVMRHLADLIRQGYGGGHAPSLVKSA